MKQKEGKQFKANNKNKSKISHPDISETKSLGQMSLCILIELQRRQSEVDERKVGWKIIYH